MRINNNMAAMNAWRNLTVSGGNLSKSLERLSSGNRINRAADDAAGLAVSEKMNAQIRGINMATRNAQDAVSLVQTAEGGASKVQDMLQRMRELSVQASSGSLQDSDRAQLSTEFDSLKDEIGRQTDATNFNNISLLKGGVASAKISGANNLTVDALNANTVKVGSYSVNITQAATKTTSTSAVVADFVATDNNTAANSGYAVKIAGLVIKVADKGETFDTQKIVDAINAKTFTTSVAAERNATTGQITLKNLSAAAVTVDDSFSDGSATGAAYSGNAGLAIFGAATSIAAGASSAATTLASTTGLQNTKNTAANSGYSMSVNGTVVASFAAGETVSAAAIATKINANAASAVTAAFNATTGKLELTAKDFGNSTVTVTENYQDGVAALGTAQYNSFTTVAGKDLTGTFQAEGNATATTIDATNWDATTNKLTIATGVDVTATAIGQSNVDVSVYNSLTVQVGSNAGDTIDISLGTTTKDNLGITNLKIDTLANMRLDQTDGTNVLNGLDKALGYVSKVRASMGAVQNRLENSIANLQTMSENLTAAASRIKDVDMASEMAQFTKFQVLQQAGTAMLAQANQLPQGVMSLLRG